MHGAARNKILLILASGCCICMADVGALPISAAPSQQAFQSDEDNQAEKIFSMAEEDSISESLNVTVIMLNRRTALLQWWPRNALMHRDVEIVFTPEYSNYKVVVGLIDPVGNSVELHDLKPYTFYQLDLRGRNGQQLYARLNFNTAMLDSKLALMYQPPGGFPPVAVKPSEVAIIGLVLIVWASAVYVFINQWGKIRGLIPYQPQYKYQEPRTDEEANVSQCLHCDTQIRQVHTFDELFTVQEREELLKRQLIKGRLNNSSIYIGPSRFVEGDYSEDWWGDLSSSALRKTKSAENIITNPTIIVNNSSDESYCDGDDEKDQAIDALQKPSMKPSSSSRNLLNPECRTVTSVRERSPSRASADSAVLHYDKAALQAIEVLPGLAGTATMVEASKKAFLQTIRKHSSLSSANHPSNVVCGNPVVQITAKRCNRRANNESHPRRQASAALAELMENSIPQTTTLFNRMYKRSPTSTSAGATSSRRPDQVRRKGRSSDSTESGHSYRHNSVEMSAALSAELALAASNRARVGSFRSRLKKQQPIMMSDPPGSCTPSRQQSESMTAAAEMMMPHHPTVAVTVHEFDRCDQQPTTISDL